MDLTVNPDYWNQKYLENNMGWDTGGITTPIKNLIDKLKDKSLSILIPGAGNGYEAAYLHQNEFENVFICEWSKQAVGNFLSSCPEFPENRIKTGDFFTIEKRYDLIIEQTFFCALPRSMRQKYVSKCSDILKPGGKIKGLLFALEFDFQGPPHGGTKEEYKRLFSGKFNINHMEIARDSIKPRAGNEFFIEMARK
jgi:thiopurine S-methyltransferase